MGYIKKVKGVSRMTKQELIDWYKLYKQVVNGYHMSDWDWQTLVRLNYSVMEATHKIHNDNMLDVRNK